MDSYREFLSQSLPRPLGEEEFRKLEELRDLIRAAGERDPAMYQVVADLAAALEAGDL